MKPFSVGRFPRGWFLFFVFGLPGRYGAAQATLPVTPSASSSIERCCVTGLPTYVGAYFSDGKFHPVSPGSSRGKHRVPWAVEGWAESGTRPKEVPGFVDLHPLERVVEDYQPPARAKKIVKRRFFLSGLRDDLITLAYGRERALLSPQHLTTDSQGRLIATDSGLVAVHVLDGKNSFRIMAGPNLRLHTPAGVAVDGEDNIYVADPHRGVVVVFDRNGHFLRELGRLGDETLFHAPTGIAIDRQNGRLYLLDTPRSAFFVLDLQGNILRRIGKGRGFGIGRYAGITIPVDLDEPSEIALGYGRLAVLDSAGSRIRIMNLQCEVLEEFNIRHRTGRRETAGEIGLGLDSAGNVYVSDAAESVIRVYDQHGHLRTSLGRPGSGAGEFSAPSGLWIDAAGRIYIADANNSRVEIFQIGPASPPTLAASK
jgi:sugar lactone lactonase YvrE